MKPGILIGLFTCLSAPIFGQTSATVGQPYRSPERFKEAIQHFEAADRKAAPPQGAILAIGSSSIRKWDTIQEDLAPLTIIPRGFGGSNMNDALHFADRIVLPYKPRAIILYEGGNDISQGVAPAEIARTFRKFFDTVHAALPECRIYVLSLKPSIKRWKMRPLEKEINQLLAELCEEDARLIYVDIDSAMLDAEGQPKPIFVEDNLHMNRAGYEIWINILKPLLLEAELPYEAM